MRYKIIVAALVAGSLLTGCGDEAEPVAAPPAGSGATPPAGSASTPLPGSSATLPVGGEGAPVGGSAAPAGAQSAALSAAPSAASASAELKAAVQAYSDAFLTGEATTAYKLLSERCRKRTSLSEFTGIVTAAKQMYGSALPLQTYSAKVSDDLARVTYTYAVKAINQEAEPWTREGGRWHQDDC